MTKDYKIAKTAAECQACHVRLDPGQELVATLRERGEQFLREDYCSACWPQRADENAPDLVGVWRTRVPRPEDKKKLLVDDGLLIDFFERLADAEDPSKINFRFVLALVLMRKKLLVYDGRQTDDSGREVWAAHFRKSNQPQRVIDPKLSEPQIAEVSQQLSQIMEADL